ncbi:4Fe-4S dicluster domain-containing protein [uncultured Rhodospira sp.]|uniref:4Fe-4S dicluster domain-containing protein n=1 Tax=uncultured Rhodospira sp. TaxID=1936189 RepID=UPI00262FDB19|nr:4Fe-4S dicluster domain-containing protein [uncultured Rhodospira sp.]
MTATTNKAGVISRDSLEGLFDALIARDYVPVGPTVREGVIVLDELRGVDDLPEGWTEDQDAATYRLMRRADAALFGFNNGQHAWKPYLFPPKAKLWEAEKTPDGGFSMRETPDAAKAFAFIGVRPCDLHAIQVQDAVFMAEQNTDPLYARRRRKAFTVVIQCGQAAKTCFCTSMDTGPRADGGFDLALTEILDADRHSFVVEAGSAAGASVLAEIPHSEARPDDLAAAEACTKRAVDQMGRTLDTTGVKDLLYGSYESRRWADLERRCLACGNCTMVCPTCFCTTVEDVTDLSGTHAERWRHWESCYTTDFSYIHGGSVRPTIRSRYRQWLVHKLATWQDQFGTSGCVGCGRCITWCPVGIDLTEEVRLIRDSERKKDAADGHVQEHPHASD